MRKKDAAEPSRQGGAYGGARTGCSKTWAMLIERVRDCPNGLSSLWQRNEVRGLYRTASGRGDRKNPASLRPVAGVGRGCHPMWKVWYTTWMAAVRTARRPLPTSRGN
jgi:hypothetical protein